MAQLPRLEKKAEPEVNLTNLEIARRVGRAFVAMEHLLKAKNKKMVDTLLCHVFRHRMNIAEVSHPARGVPLTSSSPPLLGGLIFSASTFRTPRPAPPPTPRIHTPKGGRQGLCEGARY